MKKYKIDYKNKIRYEGRTLYRIIALRDFSDVMKGDKGGYVESEQNLSQEGNCWIYDSAKAMDDSSVCENAKMHNSAVLSGKARMLEDSQIYDNARMYNESTMRGYSTMRDNTSMHGNSTLFRFAEMHGTSDICDNAAIFDNGKMYGASRMCGRASINENVEMHDDAIVIDSVRVHDNVKLCGKARLCGNVIIGGDAIIRGKSDYIVFKNWWSSGRYFIWTKSNNMYTVGCFHGTGEDLIKKAYQDSEVSGREYERIVRYVEDILNLKPIEKKEKISFIKRLLKYVTKK